MAPLTNTVKTADWKTEKHVPVIEAPETVSANSPFQVSLSLGKEVAHPNTTEHHIRWINLYYQPEGDGPVYDVARFHFNAHGESAAGANEGPVYTHHFGYTQMQIAKGGMLYALAYCNIHGLWQSECKIDVE